MREGAVRYKRDEQSIDEPHYLFLFNDLLLIARPAQRGVHPLVLMLDLINVTSVVPLLESDFVHNAFIVDTPRRSLMLLADSAAERDAWIATLNDAVAALRLRRATLSARAPLHDA